MNEKILMPREPATFMGIHYCPKHKTKTKWMDRTYNPYCADCLKENVTKGFIATGDELRLMESVVVLYLREHITYDEKERILESLNKDYEERLKQSEK